MKNKKKPNNSELPSIGKLIKSTILAIIIATVILITVVLPAEYGIDPVGIGELIGLVRMGEIKVSLAQEAAAEIKDNLGSQAPVQKEPVAEEDPKEAILKNESANNTDKLTFVLEPNEGKEIKFTMTKGATVNYLWFTDGGKANFDSHADSKKLQIKYHNYEKGKLERSEGNMVAAFDGNHGWFWRNRTSETMTVTLEVSGNYTDVLQY